MPFYTTQSQIGVDLNNTSTTALFTLNSKAQGTGNSEWSYVYASGAFNTGNLVAILNNGTAYPCTQGHLSNNAVMLGFAQGNFAAGDYGWVATRGEGLTVACSGTAATNATLFLTTTTSGGLTTVAGACTMAGIQLLASASTSSLVLTTATVTWPRCINVTFGTT